MPASFFLPIVRLAPRMLLLIVCVICHYSVISVQVAAQSSQATPPAKDAGNASGDVAPVVREDLLGTQEPGKKPPTEPKSSWYRDPNALTAITSIGALIMSIMAIFLSHRQSSEQKRREKREELRSTVEKLVSLREEFNNGYARTVDAQERQNLSIFSNTKRSVYLQAAELLAADLGDEVSSSEYAVIGVENEFESDFLQAREYYRMAVKASTKSSIMNQIWAWRSLGGSYFWLEPYRNVAEGRNCYEQAIKLLQGVSEPYLIYTKGFTYRNWADREAWAENFDEASDKLELAYENVCLLPDWYNLKAEELRFIANLWRLLANRYWQTLRNEQDLEKARSAFKKAIEVTQGLNDDNTNDIRGQIYQDWGVLEVRSGSRSEGTSLLRQADQQYRTLPTPYPNRDMKLRLFQLAVSQLAQEMGIGNIEIETTTIRESN